MKTKGITKYEVKWQVLRASMKGLGRDELSSNIQKAFSYFKEDKNKAGWERCVNWLMGVARGYKAANDLESIEICNIAIESYGDQEVLPDEIFDIDYQNKLLHNYSFKERYVLYKDLFKYEEHFCSRRYRSAELERLVDSLWQSFIDLNEGSLIEDIYNKSKILSCRQNAPNGVNNKKFFY